MTMSGLMISQVQGVTIVSFRSSSIIDMTVVEAIAGELFELIDKQAQRKIVLDFSGVRFMSSQMIGTLISMNKKAKAIQGRVILAGMKPEIMKVFQIMKLEKVLEFAAGEREAISRFEVYLS